MFNIACNVAYYFFNYRYLFRRNISFYNIPRVITIFFISNYLQQQLILKQVMMNNYRVNINELLDCDEEFLF